MNWRRTAVPFERERSERYLPLVVGLMVFLAALALTVAFALDGAMERWRVDLKDTVTVQLPTGGPATAGAAAGQRVEAALALLRATPGIERATLLPVGEVERLLEPWLGRAQLGLPLPTVIDVVRVAGAPFDRADLAQRLQAVAPGAIVEDHGEWLMQLVKLAAAVQAIAMAVVVLVGAAAAIIVVFATRAGLAVHRNTIEVLHLIGAHDDYIAKEFQTHALWLGVRGALYGIGLAALALALLGSGLADLELLPWLTFAPDLRALLALALLPVATAMIAMATARVTVVRALRRMP